MQSLYVLVLTCHHHGEEHIGQDKELLLAFQNLLEKNLNNMPEKSMKELKEVFNGSN